MFCPKCGFQNQESNQFCAGCGQSFSGISINQPAVPSQYTGQHPYYSYPPHPHMAHGPAYYVSLTSNKSKITAILLCLLGVLGIAGIHRFYVGKVFTGILWLITFGLLGLGTLIDLIQLFLGNFTDNVNQPLRK